MGNEVPETWRVLGKVGVPRGARRGRTKTGYWEQDRGAGHALAECKDTDRDGTRVGADAEVGAGARAAAQLETQTWARTRAGYGQRRGCGQRWG